MTAQRLDLFGTAGVEIAPAGPPSRDDLRMHAVALQSDSEVVDDRRTRGDSERSNGADAPHPEREDVGASAPCAKVEPYRYTLSDPAGRWTITAAHEDGTVRGKTKRSLVARCSCGWVQPIQRAVVGHPRAPDRVLAHLRTHQLTAVPPAFVTTSWTPREAGAGTRRLTLVCRPLGQALPPTGGGRGYPRRDVLSADESRRSAFVPYDAPPCRRPTTPATLRMNSRDVVRPMGRIACRCRCSTLRST